MDAFQLILYALTLVLMLGCAVIVVSPEFQDSLGQRVGLTIIGISSFLAHTTVAHSPDVTRPLSGIIVGFIIFSVSRSGRRSRSVNLPPRSTSPYALKDTQHGALHDH